MEETKTGYILINNDLHYGTWDTYEGIHPDHIFDTPDELFESYIHEITQRIQRNRDKINQDMEAMGQLAQLYNEYLKENNT